MNSDNPFSVNKIREAEGVEKSLDTGDSKFQAGDSDFEIRDCRFSQEWFTKQDRLKIPLALLDSKLRLRWRNLAFREFREAQGLEYRGREFPTLFGNFQNLEERYKFVSDVENPERGYSWKGQVHGRRGNKRVFEAYLNVFPVEFDSQDKPLWYLATINDVTEWQRTAIRMIFDSILQASLLKDEDTGNHIARVNKYSATLAFYLKGKSDWIDVDDDFIEDIGILAAFHDVGKLGTPDSVLQKSGTLSDQEWNIMKEHPIQGALILSSYPNPMAQEIARSHHERWDGTGYPYGLAAYDIPLAARIVAIADVYDALRTRRPYKDPIDEARSFTALLQGAGSHFDPHLIEVTQHLRKKFDDIYIRLQDQ